MSTHPPLLKACRLQPNIIYFLAFFGEAGEKREILSPVGNLSRFETDGNS